MKVVILINQIPEDFRDGKVFEQWHTFDGVFLVETKERPKPSLQS